MNPDLPDIAVDFGSSAARAFADLGGVDVARRAEDDPAVRTNDVAKVLAALGADELDARADDDSLAAAAALCEAAGRVALPYPVVATLLADEGVPFAVVPDGRVRIDHGDLFPTWRVATLDGRSGGANDATTPLTSRLGAFVCDLTPGDASADDASADVALHLTLTAWQVLGTVDRAVELAVSHVNDRVQFGKPIAAFQAVQFQLADAAVAVAGLRELAKFTLWRLGIARDAAMVDALALRVHAIDVARTVLRTTQQLHGAAGVCDEYDISVLARMVQPALRLPCSAERTAALLADAIRLGDFDGLFSHAAPQPGPPA